MRFMALARAPFLPRFPSKSPLFWPLAEAATAIAGLSEWPSVAFLDRLLSPSAGIAFRTQPERPRRRRRRGPVDPSALYDARIIAHAWVPTRERSWHDLLNALVWATFPRSKRALHQRQHDAIMARIDERATTLPARRSRELDGLAIVDEGGLLLLCERALVGEVEGALLRRERAPIDRALAEGRASALLFGHALYEHLIVGAQTIRAMTALLPHDGPLPRAPKALCEAADAGLSALLATPGSLADPDAFRSLPVDLRLASPGALHAGDGPLRDAEEAPCEQHRDEHEPRGEAPPQASRAEARGEAEQQRHG